MLSLKNKRTQKVALFFICCFSFYVSLSLLGQSYFKKDTWKNGDLEKYRILPGKTTPKNVSWIPALEKQLDISDFPFKLTRSEKMNWNDNEKKQKNFKAFAPALNTTEYKWYMEVISTFKSVTEKNNITYMLYAGTLIGACRHHGFVPWDDDFDVLVNASQKILLKNVLSSTEGYRLVTHKHFQWKFYPTEFGLLSRSSKWPFVDIFFFDTNDTYFYEVTYREPRYIFPLTIAMPLQKGIFENFIFPIPFDSEAYLNKYYESNPLNQCRNGWSHHKIEKRRPNKQISCEVLFDVYAFVHRLDINHNSYDELRIGKKTLYRVGLNQ